MSPLARRAPGALRAVWIGPALLCAACHLPGGAHEEAPSFPVTATATPFPTLGRIETRDPAFHEVVASDAEIEVLAAGFDWTEGPVWVPGEEAVLFSDIPRNAVFRWREDGEGTGGARLDLFLHPSGYTGDTPRGGEKGSNGLLLDPQGRLVLCQHGDRRVARLGPPGMKEPKTAHAGEPAFVTLAGNYYGKRFNSPNDAVYHSSGALYFTDPPYGLEGNVDDPAKELDFQGVYRLAPGGELTLLTDAMSRPNGIGFSPDESTLYVANSDPERAVWMAYDVQDDGSIANGRVFFDATEWVGERKGLPDGLCIDRSGNVFATGPGGVLVFTPEGEHLGTIRTGQATSNCTFGDDGSTLYMTVDMYLCRVRTLTRGPGS